MNDKADPIFIEDLGAYNIIGWRENHYALPKALGSVDLEGLGVDGIAKLDGVFIASSLDRLKECILANLDTVKRHGHPVLIESFGFYNIVAWGIEYYAIPRGLGPIDLKEDEVEKKRGVFVEISIDKLKEQIRLKNDEVKRYYPPVLIESFGFYNIVAWGIDYYGLPKLKEPINVQEDDVAKIEGVFIERSIEKLKKRIEDYCRELHKRRAGLLT